MGVVNSEWPPEMVQKLTELWADGKTATQIAFLLGGRATRCSVIGKIRRLKLPYRVERGRYDRPKPQPRPPKPVMVINPTSPAPKPAMLNGHPVTFETVRDRMCRWPVGSAPDWQCCGNPTKEHSPYCEAHTAKAYTPTRTQSSQIKAKDDTAARQFGEWR